jgi:hypothetical protein
MKYKQIKVKSSSIIKDKFREIISELEVWINLSEITERFWKLFSVILVYVN